MGEGIKIFNMDAINQRPLLLLVQLLVNFFVVNFLDMSSLYVQRRLSTYVVTGLKAFAYQKLSISKNYLNLSKLLITSRDQTVLIISFSSF